MIDPKYRFLLSEDVLRALAGRFRLLGAVSRLRIVNVLTPGPLSMADLSERTQLEQSNLSRQVAALEAGRCVRRIRRGREVHVALADASLIPLCDFVSKALQADAEQRLASLRTGTPPRPADREAAAPDGDAGAADRDAPPKPELEPPSVPASPPKGRRKRRRFSPPASLR